MNQIVTLIQLVYTARRWENLVVRNHRATNVTLVHQLIVVLAEHQTACRIPAVLVKHAAAGLGPAIRLGNLQVHVMCGIGAL